MPKQSTAGKRYKIPHVGWNSLDVKESAPCPLLRGIKPEEHFYFTHSFIAPQGSYVQASTYHAVEFPSIVQYGDKAFGVQFHPEKSSDAGLHMIDNFLALVESA